MNAGVLDVLGMLRTRLESHDPFLVVCGYRSPTTNAAMHARSSGVASNSYHIQGMAIDLRRNVLGVPYYVAADPVRALLIAQDTGGAIRGAVRGDVFFGFGGQAEERAGEMKAQGRLYVLLPKNLATRIGKKFTP